jgi:pimeloyl-ACP methyl ester carboxylesterase
VTESVVVAHGLWMPGTETAVLRQRLTTAGFQPHLFQFPTVRGTLARNVRDLAAFAGDIDTDRLHFVGYSLGGVIVLRMLMQTKLPRIGRVVCLGSPLRGSETAMQIARSAFGRAVVGRSLFEHSASGGIARWDLKPELGLIAGTRNFGLGRLLADLPGENDGTVLVKETKLPGATAHITLPVSHTQMLFDATVARQTIHFLRHGSFIESLTQQA